MNTYVYNRKVLYVDDETHLLSSFTSLMWREQVQVHTVADSTSIDSVLDREGPFAVVISDQRMPGLDGVATLNRVKERFPDTIRVMLTGYADFEDTRRAINEAGISRYINKPWDDVALKRLVHECILQYNLQAENKHLTAQLSAQNKTLQELLEGTVAQSIRLLTHLISYINPHAANQTERVRKLGKAVLNLLPDLSVEERWTITRALDLFNLGIAVLPSWIQVSLNKDGLHALERFPAARAHNLLAAELLKDIPRFEDVARVIKYQSKDYNGAGEPVTEIIQGTNLPLGSRLLHILIDLDNQSTEHFKGKDVLQSMLNYPKKYDVELIRLMLEGANSQKEKIKLLPVDELQEGMIVEEDVIAENRQVLLHAHSQITAASCKILKQWRDYGYINGTIKVRLPE